MLNNQAFATRLKKIMDYYSLSAAAFAESIEVPRSSISHIASGRNKPSLDFVLKITETYNEVDLQWLLKGLGIFPKSNLSTQSPSPKIKNQLSQKTSELEFLASTQTTSASFSKGVGIEKVLVFYADGTFEVYTPNK
jgi:transcriptional regulator with XRE-family HTH domain